ncbi:toprim domain-containing protein, partial [Patescibacteria group bacterium]
GVKNVVAIKGSALTEQQLELLKRYTLNLTLALDADAAGDMAARRGIDLAENRGFLMRVVRVVGGKDPDEVAQKDPALWQKQVKEAVPIYDYLLNSALERFDAQSAEGKKKISQELVPIFAKIQDKIVQGHYISRLSSSLQVSEEAIREALNLKGGERSASLLKQETKVVTARSRQAILEEYLLALCLQTGNWKWLIKGEIRSLVTNLAFVQIVEEIRKYLKKYKQIKSTRFAKQIPAELKEIFDNLYLYGLGDWLDDEKKIEKEFEVTVYQLEKELLKTQLQEIALKIESCEKKGDFPDQIDQLNKQLQSLLRKTPASLVK